jgi:hypothetical protein
MCCRRKLFSLDGDPGGELKGELALQEDAEVREEEEDQLPDESRG